MRRLSPEPNRHYRRLSCPLRASARRSLPECAERQEDERLGHIKELHGQGVPADCTGAVDGLKASASLRPARAIPCAAVVAVGGAGTVWGGAAARRRIGAGRRRRATYSPPLLPLVLLRRQPEAAVRSGAHMPHCAAATPRSGSARCTSHVQACAGALCWIGLGSSWLPEGLTRIFLRSNLRLTRTFLGSMKRENRP